MLILSYNSFKKIIKGIVYVETVLEFVIKDVILNKIVQLISVLDKITKIVRHATV
jgi:hypothetical protein